jgi:hypothetical protein
VHLELDLGVLLRHQLRLRHPEAEIVSKETATGIGIVSAIETGNATGNGSAKEWNVTANASAVNANGKTGTRTGAPQVPAMIGTG